MRTLSGFVWFLHLELRELANDDAYGADTTRRLSSQTQTLERRVSLTTTLVRHNDQFEYSNL